MGGMGIFLFLCRYLGIPLSKEKMSYSRNVGNYSKTTSGRGRGREQRTPSYNPYVMGRPPQGGELSSGAAGLSPNGAETSAAAVGASGARCLERSEHSVGVTGERVMQRYVYIIL